MKKCCGKGSFHAEKMNDVIKSQVEDKKIRHQDLK